MSRRRFHSRRPLLLLLIALPALAAITLEGDLRQRIERGLQRYVDRSPEKVYVHTDKPYYSAGETLWFKTYLVDGVDHRADVPSRVLYVELIDPSEQMIAQRVLRVEAAGAAGDLQLPADLPGGRYQLRAYTRYQRNQGPEYFFAKELSIFNLRADEAAAASKGVALTSNAADAPTPEFIVGFYPEGGELIAGLRSKVGIKAVDRSGRGIALAGRVIDLQGEEVARFQTQEKGLGLLSLLPEAGQLYTALVEYGDRTRRIQLPAPRAGGYTLSASTRPGGDHLNITIEASEDRSVADVLLVAHTRGRLVAIAEAAPEQEDAFGGALPLRDFPPGVAHLTLLTTQGQPVAERLVFVRHPGREAALQIDADQPTYRAREAVTLDIGLHDTTAAHLSVSVTDAASVARHPHAENIYTYLLLNADLPGRIDRPGYFFEQPGDARRQAELDLLLLTQGWRRFRWENILSEKAPAPAFSPERDIQLQGRITDRFKKSVGAGFVWLTAHQEELVTTSKLRTNDQGRFALHNLHLADTTRFLLQARKPGKRALAAPKIPDNPDGRPNVRIEFGPPERPPFHRQPLFTYELPPRRIADRYLEEMDRIRQVERAFDGMSILLDEVEITARPLVTDRYNRPGNLHGTPDFRVEADSLLQFTAPTSALNLLINANFPGISVMRMTPVPEVRWRTFPVTFLLDGLNTDAELIANLDATDVDFIDFIRPPNSGVYGLRGGPAILAFFTRNGPGGSGKPATPGLLEYTHPGYYQAREFYAPTYDGPPAAERRPDYRTTIHWEPDLRVEAGEQANLSFYAADNTGRYEVIVQGITADGRPVVGRKVLIVE